MAPPLRKRVKRAARSAALRGAIRLLSLLPLAPALALGALLGRLAWLFAGKHRRLMLEHLALAFPEKSEPLRRAIAKRSLVHLGRLVTELIAARSYAARMREYVSLAPGSEEVVRAAMARGKGVLFVAGHIGNWELLARRLAMVVQPNAVIAKRNADAKLNALVARFREEGGVRTLWREDPATGRQIIRLFRQGGGLGVLIDQDTRVQGVFAPFFGRLAFTPRAIGDLALRFRAAVLVVTSHRRGSAPGDGHELVVEELSFDPCPSDREAEVLRIVGAALAIQERAIREHPEEWVWMHERWKTRPRGEVRESGGTETPAFPGA